jgi:hypothetical protein
MWQRIEPGRCDLSSGQCASVAFTGSRVNRACEPEPFHRPFQVGAKTPFYPAFGLWTMQGNLFDAQFLEGVPDLRRRCFSLARQLRICFSVCWRTTRLCRCRTPAAGRIAPNNFGSRRMFSSVESCRTNRQNRRLVASSIIFMRYSFSPRPSSQSCSLVSHYTFSILAGCTFQRPASVIHFRAVSLPIYKRRFLPKYPLASVGPKSAYSFVRQFSRFQSIGHFYFALTGHSYVAAAGKFKFCPRNQFPLLIM